MHVLIAMIRHGYADPSSSCTRSADPGHVAPLADAVEAPVLVRRAGAAGDVKVDGGRVLVVAAVLRGRAGVVRGSSRRHRLRRAERRVHQAEQSVHVVVNPVLHAAEPVLWDCNQQQRNA